jgi:hypothetical protein
VSVLYYLETAFMIWMLVDCFRRRAGFGWYVICFVPLGAWVYFFAVKIDDYDLRWVRRLFVRPPSIDALRYAARETPSFANRIRLAEALLESGQLEEAATLFESALRSDKKDRAALHGLGQCRLALGDADGAIDVLAELVDQDASFRDNQAALDFAAALEKGGHAEDAVEVLRSVVRRNSAMAHRVSLAKALVELGRTDEARETLTRGLEGIRHAPRYIRRRDGRAAREARAILEYLAQQEATTAEPAS